MTYSLFFLLFLLFLVLWVLIIKSGEILSVFFQKLADIWKWKR